MKKIFLSLIVLVFMLIILGVVNRFGFNRITQAEVNSKPSEKGENMSEIILPTVKTTGKMSVEEAIQKRKSVRKYSATELTIEQVSQILWSAYGANPRKRFTGRTVPSAGAIYPISIYLVDKNGVYRYQSLNHSLVLVKKGDLRSELDNGQGFIKDVSINLVVAGNVAKCAKRYNDRAQRYVAMECGHVGQNVSLQAVSLGLDTVMVGAFDDERVREVLSIPQEETPFYIIPVGYFVE